MKKLLDSRGGAALVAVFVLLISLWFLIGLALRDGYRAEAVIGGAGNLGTDSRNKHNLSASATHGGIKALAGSEGGEQICIFCHTPHTSFEEANLINPPLWNHYYNTNFTNTAYSFGSSPWSLPGGGSGTNRINPATIVVDGASRMCLGCHDGTIGIGKVKSRPNPIAMVSNGCLDADYSMSSSCSGYIGTNINHHLVSIPINDQLIADTRDNECQIGYMRIRYPWYTTSDGGPNPNVLLRPTLVQYSSQPGIDGGSVPVSGYKSGYKYGVQCSSCHDPHTYRADGTISCEFLVDGCGNGSAQGTSSLCYACHSADCSPP